jgi:hypothetical protein
VPVVFRKLVRDRIPEIIQSEGRRPVTRILDEPGYRKACWQSSSKRLRRQAWPLTTIFLASWPTCWKYSAPWP